ncbi:MAG: hypothetical protein KC616_12505 [Myxococcales bacterium]|nr:hypothetical protein [Myxococcales bacterium]
MRYVVFALLACVGLPIPRPAWATTIFSSFGPGESYSQSHYIPVNFYTSPEVIGTSLAFAFDVSSGSDYVLSEVRVAASWAGTSKNAHFAIFSDSAGLPGANPALLLSENPQALSTEASVVSLPAPARLELLAGGRYWFVVEPASLDSTSPADDFVLLWQNLEASVLQTSRVSFDSGPWGDWYASPFAGAPPAFSIEAAVIPEPQTLTLMALGLAVLGRGRGRVRS